MKKTLALIVLALTGSAASFLVSNVSKTLKAAPTSPPPYLRWELRNDNYVYEFKTSNGAYCVYLSAGTGGGLSCDFRGTNSNDFKPNLEQK